ncbi:MAG TPA: cupin domain-containing protein [Puia sp.]
MNQILLVTEGTGYYQEKGKPIQLLHKGDVVKILPDVIHWHGASPDSAFTHIAVNTNTPKGIVEWL